MSGNPTQRHPQPSADSSAYRHVHMVGIGGAGMSALARLYLQQGARVSGSDESDSAALRDLAALGAEVHVGHDAGYLDDADLVVYSSAVPVTTPDLAEALRRGVRAIKHAQALGELFNRRRGIAVAGTHGKTTTSSMIAFILDRCGRDPSFQVGAELVDLRTSARWGSSEWMVIEADEFDRRFLEYVPEIEVVLNVEPDHFEYYGTYEAMRGAFEDFLGRVRPEGALVACGEDDTLTAMLGKSAARRIERYGIEDGNRVGEGWTWRAGGVKQLPGGSTFRLTIAEGAPVEPAMEVRLSVPGRHNVLNALAALAACALAGVPPREAAPTLAAFHGAQRRFQLVGEEDGIRVYEDYGHHPTEVRVVLSAARPLVPPGGRLWVVFQPHLKVRTEKLFDWFARAFDEAEQVILTDVYSPSGREPEGPYRGSAELVAAMGHAGARHVRTMEDARHVLAEELRAGDVLLVMGAGPIYQLSAEVVGDLRERAGAKTRGDARYAG